MWGRLGWAIAACPLLLRRDQLQSKPGDAAGRAGAGAGGRACVAMSRAVNDWLEKTQIWRRISWAATRGQAAGKWKQAQQATQSATHFITTLRGGGGGAPPAPPPPRSQSLPRQYRSSRRHPRTGKSDRAKAGDELRRPHQHAHGKQAAGGQQQPILHQRCHVAPGGRTRQVGGPTAAAAAAATFNKQATRSAIVAGGAQ